MKASAVHAAAPDLTFGARALAGREIRRRRRAGRASGVRVALVAGVVVAAACRGARERQSAAGAESAHASSTAFAAMEARGAMVMGVDQTTSHHVFEDLSDGGRIVLVRDDPRDTAAVRTIRAHLRTIAAAFGRGDFSDPMLVHAETVPGTGVLRQRRARVTYTEHDVPGGGEVVIRTRDPEALAAVHAFLAFQRGAHHAPGHMMHPDGHGGALPRER